jgi:hypothetical protein
LHDLHSLKSDFASKYLLKLYKISSSGNLNIFCADGNVRLKSDQANRDLEEKSDEDDLWND